MSFTAACCAEYPDGLLEEAWAPPPLGRPPDAAPASEEEDFSFLFFELDDVGSLREPGLLEPGTALSTLDDFSFFFFPFFLSGSAAPGGPSALFFFLAFDDDDLSLDFLADFLDFSGLTAAAAVASPGAAADKAFDDTAGGGLADDDDLTLTPADDAEEDEGGAAEAVVVPFW